MLSQYNEAKAGQQWSQAAAGSLHEASEALLAQLSDHSQAGVMEASGLLGPGIRDLLLRIGEECRTAVVSSGSSQETELAALLGQGSSRPPVSATHGIQA